jgi:cell wall-associated NlpC family hydrolase
MYSSATTDADVVSQAIYATPVIVLEEKDGWAKVRTPDDYTGWVEGPALLAAAGGEPYGAGPNVVQVRSLFAHMYREMDVTKHAPLLTVPFETRLETAGADAKKSERWLQVRLPDGRPAFIQNADVGPVVNNLTVPQTLEVAKKFLGMPYTWGGTSSYGFDCSGFTQMLMRQRGYNMPRDAGPQANWSGLAPVERNALQPGDLLFFGSSPARITHTGMYLGDNLFINATTHDTPMVRIDNLSDAYWTKLLVGARRVR